LCGVPICETRQGRQELFTEVAEEFVRLKVDAIVTFGTSATLAAKSATSTIPIISALLGDAVATGLVSSYADRAAT
jgi:putative tryptophan/tyrosine transport system substrate-binding protein